MAGMVQSLSVTWQVSLEAKYPQSMSRKFCFRGKEWFMTSGLSFTLVDSRSYEFIFIKFHWVGESLKLPIAVSVQVGDSHTGQVLPTLFETRHDVIKDDSEIWSKSVADVERADSCFTRYRKLIFRVTLGDKNADQKSIPTTNSSVQIFSYAKGNPNYACLESLSADLSKLLDEDSNPDVELLCEGHTTRAHKNVLCSRSPVLAKMLLSDMVEGRTGVVNVRDMTNESLQQFLTYLYTGKLEDPLTFDTAMSLYEIGDLYAVHSLSRICSQFLIDNLKGENACEVLTVGDSHSDSSLGEAAISFILEKEIPLMSDRWSTFCGSHPVLANEVLNRFCKAQSCLLSKLKPQES